MFTVMTEYLHWFLKVFRMMAYDGFFFTRVQSDSTRIAKNIDKFYICKCMHVLCANVYPSTLCVLPVSSSNVCLCIQIQILEQAVNLAQQDLIVYRVLCKLITRDLSV